MEEFLKLGLLNWYPMQCEASALIIGIDNVFVQDLCRRGMKATYVRSLKEWNSFAQYDYVVASGDCFFEDVDANEVNIRSLLKPDGHLFLACNNRLALRYFAGDVDPYTGYSFDGIENYIHYTEDNLQNLSGRCFAKNEIEEHIKELGFAESQYRGYSVFPGLEMPQLIYSWDYLPNENMEFRYTPLYNDADRIFLNETKVCDSLIENGMFHAMANAYFVDCSFGEQFYEFHQVTTSMERGEENATATIIQKNGRVIKKALYPKGNVAIKTLANNMKILSQRGIATVELDLYETGCCDGENLMGVQMEYVEAPLAMEYLQELLYRDKETFKKEVCRFLDTVLQSGTIEESENSELGFVYKKTFFDLVPINCFVIDGEYVFFDQEYVIESYPINVVLTRVLDFLYVDGKRAEERLPMSYFTEKYCLEDKLPTYRAMSVEYLNRLKHATDLLQFHSAHKAESGIIHMNRQKMQFDTQTYLSLFVNYLKDASDKKIFLFGSGRWAKKFVAEYGDLIDIEGMLDNNRGRWGTTVEGITVMQPEILRKLNPTSYKVIVCIKQYAEILIQLKALGVCNYGVYNPNIDISEMTKSFDVKAGDEGIKNPPEQLMISDGDKKPYHIGFVAGVFDLFHIGHLNLLRRAKEQCDILLVGVVSDEQASKGKKHSPYISEQERLEIVEACRYVDKGFLLPIESASARDVYKKYHFDVMFSGDDYKDNISWLTEQTWLRAHGSDIVFFPYTESTSSTKLKEAIEKESSN